MTAPREVAGRYRLDSRLGAGGMSTVFLAMDTVLERQVAVKLLAEHLAEDETFVTRFRNEALAAARLQHPNVVQVFDSGLDEASDRHFIVMEYVEGPSCADLLREQKRLEVEEAVRIVRDACLGLDYAHRAGVVHRDVKPGNLLVSKETGGVKLADFGIAKAAEQTRVTQVGSVLGTAAYLSPEQARGEEASSASDIYSLGVCTYQFMAGRLPHEYNSLTELALKQQQEPVASIAQMRPEVTPALDRAVRMCLEPDRENRYGSALELAEALAAGLRGEYTAATQALTASTRIAAGEETQSTRALATGAAGTRVAPAEGVAAGRARAERRADRDPGRRRGVMGRLFAFLLVLAAGAAVALAIIAANESSDVPRVVEDSVNNQVEELKSLIREYSE